MTSYIQVAVGIRAVLLIEGDAPAVGTHSHIDLGALLVVVQL